MIRTGTVSKERYADSDAVAGVAVQEGPATDRAQYDACEKEYPLSAQDLNDPQFTTTESVEAEVKPSAEDVMELLIHIATVTGLKAAYRHSSRGAAVASPFIIAGGLLLGPVGIFIGGAVGGFIGWMISEDFKPVPQILMKMPAAEKKKLCAEAMAALKNVKLRKSDASYLIKLVMSNVPILDKILGVLTNFITKKLEAKPKYRK
ncbi:protein C19orf12 homolog [Haemorhous mexicanus]|uniref:protein C19orf12 homolog n=1 Tax=Haemorhous mexicanus TaxID=30427 RepID=UPI0028BE65CD|nr:protein C19orf12 homolog [Haemorhous mexicanus]XP_059713000.1 protein C19orf12 homolog [Haemorhous mexicanus]